MWVSAAAPVLTPMPLGTGGGEQKEGKTWTQTSKSAQVSRRKRLKRMISLHSFPPLTSRCGEGACCGVGGRQTVVMQIPASLFSTARPAFGEVQQFQHCLWDFSEGTATS